MKFKNRVDQITSVRFSADTYNCLREISEAEDRTLNYLVRVAVAEYLEKKNQKPSEVA